MPSLFDYLKKRQEEEKMKGAQPLPPGQGAFADSMRKAFKTPTEAQAKPDFQDVNPNAGGIRNFDRAFGAAAGQRKPSRVQYNKQLDKSKLIYDDGTEELMDGRYNGR